VNLNRVEKGVPTGGQFSADSHAEPDVRLGFDRGDRASAADMSAVQIKEWITGQASHHLSPVIGWLRMDAEDGKDTSGHVKSFYERVGRLADDVAERFSSAPEGLERRAEATNVASEAIWEHMNPLFREMAGTAGDVSRLTAVRWRIGAEAAAEAIGKKVTAPAPVLDGFTAAEVEDHLAREQHERQCACDLKDDICATESYGQHWRHRMGVPDVEGIFETIQEMAAVRAANAEAEQNQ
jgi:hypothetical protein